jgi:branched-chain amino acid transport system ATP-binding protein
LLELKNITVKYQTAEALKAISLQVLENEIVALIGANGSGKSTVLKTISGLNRITEGEILFHRKRIDGSSPVEIVRSGIVHVPEGNMLFPEMTARENLFIGAYLQNDKRESAKSLEEVFALFPILKKRERQSAGSLSGGEQKMLAIGRGLMARPRLLLFDEPSLGLAPIVVQEIMLLIPRINQKGIAFLLVEQNAHEALKLANRAYVLEVGTIIMGGNAATIFDDKYVRRAYLGI